MSLQMSRLTREYVKTTVTTSVSVTGDTVEFAFPNQYEAPTAWTEGEWVPGTTYDARLLVSGVGKGGDVELPAGAYDCWIRVTDNPEIPVRRFDELYINP